MEEPLHDNLAAECAGQSRVLAAGETCDGKKRAGEADTREPGAIRDRQTVTWHCGFSIEALPSIDSCRRDDSILAHDREQRGHPTRSRCPEKKLGKAEWRRLYATAGHPRKSRCGDTHFLEARFLEARRPTRHHPRPRTASSFRLFVPPVSWPQSAFLRFPVHRPKQQCPSRDL